MSLFKVLFTGDIELTYSLVDSEIVELWKTLIVTQTANDLCKINNYVGNASEASCLIKIDRLCELADIINERVPEQVIKLEINSITWQKALHSMHVHFPELKNNIKYADIWHFLTEYNDIIHWLEASLRNIWGVNKLRSDHSLFRITLDFNKSGNNITLPIPKNAYESCDPFFRFGQLSLHYTHVGKHPLELFVNNDLICPVDQLVPQRTFSSSVRMGFSDDFHSSDLTQYLMITKWKKFYELRGGKDFWGYEIDDPMLAFGYINIGQLVKISVNGVSLDFPLSVSDIDIFRKRLGNTAVLNWTIE